MGSFTIDQITELRRLEKNFLRSEGTGLRERLQAFIDELKDDESSRTLAERVREYVVCLGDHGWAEALAFPSVEAYVKSTLENLSIPRWSQADCRSYPHVVFADLRLANDLVAEGTVFRARSSMFTPDQRALLPGLVDRERNTHSDAKPIRLVRCRFVPPGSGQLMSDVPLTLREVLCARVQEVHSGWYMYPVICKGTQLHDDGAFVVSDMRNIGVWDPNDTNVLIGYRHELMG